MTTTAEASKVLTIVSLLHRRTAPRIDDQQAAVAIATLWAETFSAHNLALEDLIAGVKLRAQFAAEAPEPAEIIEFARKVRRDRQAAEGPTPEYEALCESKAEDAEELSALRAQRELAPKTERPALPELMGNVGKSVRDDE